MHQTNFTSRARAAPLRDDTRLRFACRLFDVIHQQRLTPRPLRSDARSEQLRQLIDACRAVDRTDRLCWRALGHNWDGAYARLQPQLHSVAEHARACADAYLRAASRNHHETSALAASPKDLVDELRSLEAEFDDIQIDLRQGVLSAATPPITLEGVHLGRFRIELHLSVLKAERVDGAIRCVALDPNPATCSDSTTHPHVRDDLPCLGDATTVVCSALRDGRVVDAFLAVRAVLQTYNDESPYVSLDEWEGRACGDCGRFVSEEDLHYCEACGTDACGDCSSSCDACGQGHCQACLERDDDDQELCPDCRGRCSECGRVVATATLDEHDGMCPACQEDHDEADDDDDEQSDDDDVAADPTNTPSQQEHDHEPSTIPAATSA